MCYSSTRALATQICGIEVWGGGKREREIAAKSLAKVKQGAAGEKARDKHEYGGIEKARKGSTLGF
jgi:hypothetical protein